MTSRASRTTTSGSDNGMISNKAITLANSPHMTDGFTEFFCLYLYGVYTVDGATVLEVIDFMIDKTYFMKVFKTRFSSILYIIQCISTV